MTGRQATVYRIAPQGAAWRQAGEEIVVLDTATSVYYGLDPAAARLWRRLADGATSAELAEALAADTDETPERVAADVDRFLAELDGYGLLQRA
ncbi:PqqD family protein [Micromonospora sp. NPDC000089]|uniref:PqqD family protein n=1 Tax=unclassified Micromonospora TaxID=2617518 RepID=UPI0036903D34